MSLRIAMIVAFCLTVIVLGSVLPSVAEAQVQILSPSPGATVHGIVQIEATKPQAGEGWITYSVSPSQDMYLAAAMSPFSIKWNTQLYRGNERVYPDGQYTITATGFDGSGRRQGQASVTVTVANDIKPFEIGLPVELRTNYKRGQLFDYKIQGKTTVNVPGEAGEELREPPQTGMGGPMGGPMAGGGPAGAFPAAPMGGPMAGGMPGATGRPMPPGVGGPMAGGGMPPGMGGMGAPGGMGMGGGMGQSGFVGLPSHIDIEIDGRWEEDVLSASASGRAVVDKDLQNGYYTVSWLWPKEVWTEGMEQKEEKNIPDSYAQVLPTAGGEYRFKVFPLGRVEKMHEEQPEFPLGHSFIELPIGPVRIGATWQGEMAYTPSPTSIEPTIVSATHRLDSFEYRGNHRCARIVSKYTEKDATIEIAGLLPWRQEQVGGMGMAGAAGGMLGAGMGPGMAGAPGGMTMPPAGMAMPPAGMTTGPGMPGAGPGMGMGMPGGGFGAGPGAMGGAGGMAGGAVAAPSKFKGDISVERVSYFSLDAGRIIAFEDTITQEVKKTSSEGEMYRASGEKVSVEQDMDLYVTSVQPIIAAMVGGATTMGGGVGGGMPGAGMMGPGVAGGMPGMGGAGMGVPGVGAGGAPPGFGGRPMMPGGTPPGMGQGMMMPGGTPPGMGQGMMMPGGTPPGMGQGMMMPGGTPPGMGQGMMMPGGTPPGMGQGMMGIGGGMGMQMKPPTKATLEITTEWYVFDTTAGISQYAVASEEGEQSGGKVIKVRPSEAFAHKHALGGAGAASKEGLTFAVDLNAHSFRPVGRYYMAKEHEEIVTTTRDYLLALGYIPE